MKTVIPAGGFGTRISEESTVKAKPAMDIRHRYDAEPRRVTHERELTPFRHIDLAAHGHAARQDVFRVDVGERQSAREGLVRQTLQWVAP